MSKSESVFECPQERVVVERRCIDRSPRDACTGCQRLHRVPALPRLVDRVVRICVVLIPGHDEQAVVRLGPLGVGVHMGLQPRVARGDPGVVHVIDRIGDDETQLRQRGVVRREGREVRLVCPGVGELAERVVAAGVQVA
jgi:hypothetical protein